MLAGWATKPTQRERQERGGSVTGSIGLGLQTERTGPCPSGQNRGGGRRRWVALLHTIPISAEYIFFPFLSLGLEL